MSGKNDQVLCDFQGSEIYGGASCPYCGKRSVLVAFNRELLLSLSQRCEHADMAVDAGRLEIAIIFYEKKPRLNTKLKGAP